MIVTLLPFSFFFLNKYLVPYVVCMWLWLPFIITASGKTNGWINFVSERRWQARTWWRWVLHSWSFQHESVSEGPYIFNHHSMHFASYRLDAIKLRKFSLLGRYILLLKKTVFVIESGRIFSLILLYKSNTIIIMLMYSCSLPSWIVALPDWIWF